MSSVLFHFFKILYIKKNDFFVKILPLIFFKLGAIIQKSVTVKALFLNRIQLVPPFYDENWRRSIDLKYEMVNVG